ncbi:hypothetical protein DFH07DRAFT_963284 [Mycena maculata]|uniref:Uncharacterized protein n=1 Tax=Mycena maculata TaxID=230809 RepID=A0AAD7ILI8_9AGAR|nr:hypothetical protein DFH07DRAFT_963284 [Mycena maculata]
MATTNSIVSQEPAAILRAQIIAFNVFALLGLVWLSAVLITAATSPTVRRSKVWFAHLGAWTAYSLSYIIIIGWQTGPQPPYTVCVFQAGLIYTCPPLAGLAGLCFLIDIYMNLSAVLFDKKMSPRWSVFLAVFPYVFSTCVFIRVLLFVEDPTTVQRHISHLYCHITTTTE